jgi:hypothetical protein
MFPSFHLEPIDEENPAAGYRAIVNPSGIIDREAFAQALVEEGLPTDAETVLAICEAEQAAIASLMWEGWDVAAPIGTMETPWPDAAKAVLLGGTVAGRPTASKKQLRYRMIEHGFPRKHGHVNAFFAVQEQVTLRMLRGGYQIEHPLGWVYPLIEGVFYGPDDEYDPQRHSLDVGFGELDIKDWLEGYRMMAQREMEGPPHPLLDGYEDVDTGLTDGPLSPGHEVWLRGYWLRFRRADPEQGIFLIAKDGATRREGAATFAGLCRAIFTLPRDLPPGSYRLEVRAILIPRDGLQRGALPAPVPVVADAAA